MNLNFTWFEGLMFEPKFLRGVHAWELEVVLSFMDIIYGSSVRGFGEDNMCWKPNINKGFIVHG